MPGSPVTAGYGGEPLLTGSCTIPQLASITERTGLLTEYPEIGCSPDRPECCPYPFADNVYLTECPHDYYTTLGGCCPS